MSLGDFDGAGPPIGHHLEGDHARLLPDAEDALDAGHEVGLLQLLGDSLARLLVNGQVVIDDADLVVTRRVTATGVGCIRWSNGSSNYLPIERLDPTPRRREHWTAPVREGDVVERRRHDTAA